MVDDNASNRDLLFRRLSRDGHEVTRAESGQRALEILAVEEFDLVLLDLMMPDLNGFQVLERLKADERLHDVPVIMISGLQETDSVIRCIEAGAEDYLTKPFNPVLLRARISACLERKRWRERERRYLERIELEREKYEALLRNILPGQIVTRLNDGEVVIADRVEEATILFADLVGFTEIAARLSPARLVDHLNRIFSAFDDLCRQDADREDQDHRRRLHGGRRSAPATARPDRRDGRVRLRHARHARTDQPDPRRSRSRSGSASTPGR